MMDAYNEREYRRRRHWNRDQVCAELESVRADFLALLRAMPSGVFNRPIQTPWGPRLPMRNAIAVMAEHEREHTQQIQRAMDKLP
jgi:hypothetical protein